MLACGDTIFVIALVLFVFLFFRCSHLDFRQENVIALNSSSSSSSSSNNSNNNHSDSDSNDIINNNDTDNDSDSNK